MINRTVILFLFSVFSVSSRAHVRWFVDADSVTTQVSYPMDLTMLIVTVGGGIFLTLCWWLNRENKNFSGIQRLLHTNINISLFQWQLLRACVLVYLISNILLNQFLAPNFILAANYAFYIQLFLIILLIVSPKIFGIASIILLLLAMVLYPLSIWIDYIFEFVSISFGLVLVAESISRFDRGLPAWSNGLFSLPKISAVTVIRWGVGIQLMVLAIHNKLLDPNLALVFIQENSFYNFMPALGFDGFKNIHFVYAAGIAEFCFGLALLSAWSTRLVVVVVGLCFLTTSILTGTHELIGHIPILAMAVILFISPSESDQRQGVFSRNIAYVR